MRKLLHDMFNWHDYRWTKATKDWFFTGEKKGRIGSVCVYCGKESDRL